MLICSQTFLDTKAQLVIDWVVQHLLNIEWELVFCCCRCCCFVFFGDELRLWKYFRFSFYYPPFLSTILKRRTTFISCTHPPTDQLNSSRLSKSNLDFIALSTDKSNWKEHCDSLYVFLYISYFRIHILLWVSLWLHQSRSHNLYL